MTKSEACYFLEGLAAGIAAPSNVLAKALFIVLAKKYGIERPELEVIREEIDGYLDEAEQQDHE